MTKEEEAIAYFESQKKILEDFRKIYPSPDTVGYQAITKEISFYDMTISALSENKCFEGMTNGEVICSVFDAMVLIIKDGKVWVEKIYFPFDEIWWNAPYKKGE